MELKTWKRQFEEFVDQTDEERRAAERDRDFVDHKQWTDHEIAELRKRGQMPVTNNRVKKKHQFLSGIEIRSRTDPKAFPRTPNHEQDAEAITDALRYVQDNSSMDWLFSECFDELICEGREACIVEVAGPDKEIFPRHIPWDRFYYDPHSRERDFSDAKYMGVSAWMDADDANRMFGWDASETAGSTLDTTFEDRPKWFDRRAGKRTRVRVNEHYYIEDGEWKYVFFSGENATKPKPSWKQNDKGQATCPIEAQSAFVDRENKRYGVIRGDIWLQREVNARRSKALQMVSSVTLVTEKGAVESVDGAMRALKSGDAAIEMLNPGARFDIDHNQELSAGQLAMYQDAKNELDDTIVTSSAPAQGESGRSKLVDRENDTDELAVLFESHRQFKLRVWRQIWDCIRQSWTAERWVRVTDDEDTHRFVGLNQPFTGRDAVAEQFGIQVEEVDQVLLTEGLSMMPGQLDRVVGVSNEVAKMDMDIVLAESPDLVTIQQEQFEVVANLAQGRPELFEAVVQLSSLRNKEDILEKISGNPEQREAALQQAQQQQAEAAELNKVDTLAKARKNNAQADQTVVETQLALRGQESIG